MQKIGDPKPRDGSAFATGQPENRTECLRPRKARQTLVLNECLSLML